MNGQYNPGDFVLGNWTLAHLIGEGSYGRVFEAEREDFGTTYKAAIKIITIPQSQSEIASARAEGMSDESVTAYFRSFVEEIVREFALMSELKGTANIVSYEDHAVAQHDAGIGWDIFIRMELLTPLLHYTAEQSFTRHDATKLGMDMCRALELCQKFNIVHRDIKPENIFVSKLGDYKLGDFGIARTVEKTTSGLSKKGTYTYMAPEIYRGEAYGPSVDMYSLGIVLYRLLNDNRAPFLPEYPAPITHGEREAALAKRISGAKLPVPKNADGRLAEIVLKACAYDPKDRYSSPMQMRQELDAILYSREEAPIIYPQGDAAPIKSVDYVSEPPPPRRVQPPIKPVDYVSEPPPLQRAESPRTETPHTETPAREVTDSIFGNTAAPTEKTESVFGRTVEKTDSMFGSPVVSYQYSRSISYNNNNKEHDKSKEAPSATYDKNDDERPWYAGVRIPKRSKFLLAATIISGVLTMFALFDLIFGLSFKAGLLTPYSVMNTFFMFFVLTSILLVFFIRWKKPVHAVIKILVFLLIVFVFIMRLLPSIRYGVFSGGYITIKGVQYSTSLTQLELSDKGLTNEDIVDLAYMTNLTDLWLGRNQISDITPISGLTNLTNLDLCGNQISDLAPLSGLSNLGYLDLYGNQISDITPISSLTNLAVLYLWGNQISDITPISGLTNLTVLDLCGNQISDLAPLSGLSNLRDLDLGENQIVDWTPVAHVPQVGGRP